jgi:predicted nucleic acid-binding protein
LADATDPHNRWTAEWIGGTDRPFVVTSAAIAEATHLLENGPRALAFLEKLVGRMQVEDPAPVAVLAEMQRWGRHMDYADACAVLLARKHRGAVVLTTDHRDFSIYRVPFVSPKGEFFPTQSP